jgi:hypothetical protein
LNFQFLEFQQWPEVSEAAAAEVVVVTELKAAAVVAEAVLLDVSLLLQGIS